MLYRSTRSMTDTYTAAKALSEDRTPDGGFYVPLQIPVMEREWIKNLSSRSFSQTVADVINLFFSANLDSWDVEFAVGRYPVRTVCIGSREIVAEAWHNPVWKFERFARGIEKAIRQSDAVKAVPSDWLMIASRIAVLFGVVGELIGQGKLNDGEMLDIGIACTDFSGPMAAWYAKKMGLPVSTVLCCCNDNNGPWSLLHKGQIRTDVTPVETGTLKCDIAVPEALERLIFDRLGVSAVKLFTQACDQGGIYYLEQEQAKLLRDCFYVPVTGQRRLESAVRSLYQSCGYPADVYTALCYSGVFDYRSVTGEGRQVLILSEESPDYSLPFLARCLNVSPSELKARMNDQR